jgi:hypothetical protein
MLLNYELTRPYRAERVTQPNSQSHIWRYVLRVTHQPGPELAILVGDFLHNVRTSLDHIAVASVPASRRRSAGFPVLQRDPWETDADGNYLVESDAVRTAFESRTRGLAPEALALVKKMQPYTVPESDRHTCALDMLSRLENADKHRGLVTVASGVEDITTTVSARGHTLVQNALGFRDDGVEVANFEPTGMPDLVEHEVRVNLDGTARVVIPLRDASNTIVNFQSRVVLVGIVNSVKQMLVSLEPYVRND